MIIIDGSFGEGGGQILRTSLALSLVTGKFFRIENIRSGRKKPGLMRQHLTCVHAAANIGKARVKGDYIGSESLFFEPTMIRSGSYNFSVGTAGSTTLVLQSILPALLIADGKSEIVLEGGTHNPFAPPFDFLEKVFLPIIKKMGAEVKVTLDRPGFYPAGGGKISVTIKPVKKLDRIDIVDRGRICARFAKAVVANLPLSICKKELDTVCKKLKWDRLCTKAEEAQNSRGPGNIITLEVASENVTELFTGFGQKNVRAEYVAQEAIDQARRYIAAEVPVGRYLADQIMIPMAMAGGGRFRTLPLTGHSMTNVEVIKEFVDIDVAVTKISKDVYEVEIKQS
ncbi:MAG: RNA 3'-terminal phosphate cyclase [Planctomycetes bacterium]|nr:RNA 3'-terminal phosphate cyclase [Planctomycetota bacterium]